MTKTIDQLTDEELTDMINLARGRIAKCKQDLINYESDERRYLDEHERRRKAKRFDTVNVSDHAVVRYMQRVMGVDTEKVRDDIATLALPAVRSGAVSLTVGEAVLKLAQNSVTTVLHAPNGEDR